MRWCVKKEGDRNRDGGAWDEQGEAKEGRGKKKKRSQQQNKCEVRELMPEKFGGKESEGVRRETERRKEL